jgi:hypothetical protein
MIDVFILYCGESDYVQMTFKLIASFARKPNLAEVMSGCGSNDLNDLNDFLIPRLCSRRYFYARSPFSNAQAPPVETLQKPARSPSKILVACICAHHFVGHWAKVLKGPPTSTPPIAHCAPRARGFLPTTSTVNDSRKPVRSIPCIQCK